MIISALQLIVKHDPALQISYKNVNITVLVTLATCNAPAPP